MGKDRTIKVKILFLSPWFPAPAVNGSKIRIYHLLRTLAGQHDIHLISFIRPGELVDIPATESLCSQVETVPYHEFQPGSWRARLGFFSSTPRSVIDTFSNDMKNIVQAKESWPDVVVASQIVTARYASSIHTAARIFEEVELSSGRDAWINTSGFQRFRRRLTWEKTRLYMRRLLPKFNALTTVSMVEQDILGQVAPGCARVEMVPNGIDIVANSPDWGKPVPNRLVYSGALTYSANYDAVQYFLETILPLIRQHNPQAHLQVTGTTQGIKIDDLPLDESVNLIGFVEDIRPVVAGAWVCVVPLRQGGGTRIKILEAMALGTPVVATSKGAEGLDVTHNENILIADHPGEFALHVVRLLNDSELRARLVMNARRLVVQRYSWDQIGKEFCDLVESVAGS